MKTAAERKLPKWLPGKKWAVMIYPMKTMKIIGMVQKLQHFQTAMTRLGES